VALTTCPKCRGKLSTTAVKCPHCGREGAPGGETFTCYECHAKVPATQEFCPECGCPLKAQPKPAPPEATKRPCPGCDRLVAANAATCPSCGEEVLGRVVSYCANCRDEYIVAEADKTFTCPRCKKVCDIAEGVKILKDLELRLSKRRKRSRLR
jgi:RNA polymerase subunit RPABC4/transcription elongation factor Spt4